ncbi:uncharacterized protein LOC121862706 [Homarus americanus]|uniref:Putative Methyltransferase domain-containing protein 3 n=1 Tax=Homarus americanus TaxID=6706 RepID=A0A8J5NE03_HOMAM|nr:uncharacterized protein LOC121862706 [Homarus americanus]XP_042216964.1 uncharacterized protein LOC121862706 [Homarus americanus]XP_042216972.1 uncharacterized protein LOC121862706 [Homarus americanus]XP_042216979.1 uncharacterized protein LOC121862706 [Homarus americanus]XP_042216986.1 uncharacterized protein LOC121862706 [Homarus americanus]KAG7177724.1 putative Methyltransferase domain-containing protein 3 [Homarus americanus]
MDTTSIVLSSAVVITTGVAALALYKWHHTREVLKTYQDRYNDQKEIQRQMFHHYGSLEDLSLLREIIPKEAENYHLRLAQFCNSVCDEIGVPKTRVLDVGSGAGGLSFNLSVHFREVVGTDISYYVIASAQQLKQFGEFGSPFSSEGGKHIILHCVRVPDDAVKERVVFWHEDVCALLYTCGKFDCVVVSNTLTDMQDPKSFLSDIGDYVDAGGMLFISDIYNWRDGPEELLGGEGDCLTPSLLKKVLDPKWTLEEEKNMPFFVPRCRRLAELGNAHVTVWKRRETLVEPNEE